MSKTRLYYFESLLKKIPPKIIKCRDKKHFDKNVLHDLDSKLLQGDLYRNCDEPYEKLSEVFVDILNHRAPLKEKKIRDNHASFMIKKVSKAIMEKLKARVMYLKWPSRENYASCKNCKKKFDSLTKKAKKFFLEEATEDGIMSKKGFGVLPNLL